MRFLRAWSFAGVILVSVWWGRSLAAEKAQPPASLQGKNCADAGCHDALKKVRYVHGPVAIDSCNSCHKLKDEPKHKFDLTQPAETLCSVCHLTVARRSVKHTPAAEGICISCHNPHGSNNKTLLKNDDPDKLCVSCHDSNDLTKKKKHVHGPVESGLCTACHEPHDSDHAKLLKSDEKTLCTTCHDDAIALSKAHKSTHKPVQDGCLKCHSGHSSDESKLLVAALPDLCYQCHADKKASGEDPANIHEAALKQHGCQNCHAPHTSDAAAALGRKQHIELCLNCHDKQITQGKRVVPNVKQMIANAKYKHGPLKDGDCSGCHDVHGPQKPSLLAKAYPADFYAPFKAEDYALCFSCHNKDLALAADTDAATGFRNGKKNLHFIHVNRPTKGRTCRACHTAHACNEPKMIADTVTFGQWQLPIGFKMTATGGSCESGCHLPRAYDRANAIDSSKPLNVQPAKQESQPEDEEVAP